MAQDVSGFGTIVRIVADVTFPAGFTVTQFANDSDPVDLASVKIADVAMGLNGDMLSWAKAQPVPCVLNVIPGSEDDQNLQILANANRVAQGKISNYDNITMTVIYPDGTNITLIQGRITDAMFGKSIASEGRLKTRAYAFSFQDKVGA